MTYRQTGIVQIGLTRDAKHNYYIDGNGPLPSVTTILRIVDKSGPLVGWAKRITAEAAVDHRAELEGWVQLGGRDGAVGFLTKAASTVTERAATTGANIHALAESITLGHDVTVTDEQAPFVAAYRQWLADFAPEFLAAEEMVCNVSVGYAGTFDAIVKIAGEMWLLDLKTGKGIYPDMALQLAAYGHSEFIGRAGEAVRFGIPPIDHYGILHVRPEGYELVPYDVGEAEFDAFLAAKRLYDWRQDREPKMMGQAIGPRLVNFPHAPAKEAIA